LEKFINQEILMRKEKLRISPVEIESFPLPDLKFMLIGHDIMNNLNIVRCDDITNGDIVFYEKEQK